jgi:hypothetical protein
MHIKRNPMTSRVSLSIKTARKELDQLLEERELKWAEIDKHPGDQGLLLIFWNQIKSIDNRIREVQEFYNMHLLGSLESETRQLKWLTVVLIVLTSALIVLAASSAYRVFA